MLKRLFRPLLVTTSAILLSACGSSDLNENTNAIDQQSVTPREEQPSPTPSETEEQSTRMTEEGDMGDAGANSPDNTPSPSQASELEFSGDYKEDLRSIGVEVPDEEGYALLVERYERQYCEPSVSDDSNWLHFQLSLFEELDQGNDDIVRVVVNYECKHRMDLVEDVFEQGANR